MQIRLAEKWKTGRRLWFKPWMQHDGRKGWTFIWLFFVILNTKWMNG